ncbi:MAG: transferase [Bryobacteraceae bacterium]|nr:transferase [Bryobacteraceae bacterium]
MTDLFDDYEESPEISCTSAPFIRERKRNISLHFNVFGVQSEMDTRMPNRLVLGYTRTMMGFLLFNPNPRHIGMIGLGGGSIQKYCHHYLPDTRISVAEVNAEVIGFRDCFHIPRDDHRFKVTCEDGADFVRRQQNQFDVLIVDGFDTAGQPAQLCSQVFYDNCYMALTPEGILVVNVYEGRNSLLISRVRKSFQDRVVAVGGDDSDNAIVFAARGKVLGQTNEQFTSNGQSIERAAACQTWGN